MNWNKLKIRIRRFLRDPNANIWEDSELLRIYNDEQTHFCNKSGLLEKVDTLRVPPRYQMSYLFDWEWPYAEHSGKTYQALRYNQQSDMVFCHLWEAQQLSISTGSESDYGWHYTHPWEAWYADTPGKAPPVWFPNDFRKTKYIAWDKDPIEGATLKHISSQDPSWYTRTGIPINYYRIDELSNEFYLYPFPSNPVFEDLDGDGQIIFDDENTESAETGTVIDMEGRVMNMDGGIAIDSLSADDNILLVYEAEAIDIETMDDSGSLPGFLQKYNIYATLERAYSMNTDGQIESLRDYWGWRKNIGMEVVRTYKGKRRTDRDYQLVTKGVGGRRNIKHPRLPDTYPAVF